MPSRAHETLHHQNSASTAFRPHQDKGATGPVSRVPWHAWPANDNKLPVWRGALSWSLVGMGMGCFAFVAVSLLL